MRRETLYRATTDIMSSAQIHCIEDLAVETLARGMGRRGFCKSGANAAPGDPHRQITYKARRGWFRQSHLHAAGTELSPEAGVHHPALPTAERDG